MALKGKKLHPNDIQGIKGFTIAYKGLATFTMSYKDLILGFFGHEVSLTDFNFCCR
jgi:hypothetical protein